MAPAFRAPRRVLAVVGTLVLALAACAPVAPATAPVSTPVPADAARVSPSPNTAESATPAPRVGSLAPDFSLQTVDGGTMRLSDLRGRTVLVNFWATWCPPCREEMPDMQALWEERRDDGLVVLAVNQGEDAATARGFLEEHGLTFPVALDRDSKVSRQYLVFGLPTSFWVDASGVIVDKVSGAMPGDVMRAKAARALAVTAEPAGEVRPVRERASPEEASQVVVTRGGQPLLRREDVDRRLDLLLALERLGSGTILDPARSADRAEIENRRRYACQNLVDEVLLVDAAERQVVAGDGPAVDREVERMAETMGGPAALQAQLARHGAGLDDLRALFGRDVQAHAYVDDHVLTAETVGPPDQALKDWLVAERQRQSVQVVGDGC